MKKIGLLIVMILATGLSGCISISNKDDFGDKGSAPDKSTLNKIKKGKTTEQWVTTILGSPSRQKQIDETKKLMTYEYCKDHKGSFSMPFLDISDDKKEFKRIVFEIENGIVKDWWIDK